MVRVLIQFYMKNPKRSRPETEKININHLVLSQFYPPINCVQTQDVSHSIYIKKWS